MFFFTGVYETVAQAESDYEAIKRLHDNGDIGSYDAAVLSKSRTGEINVNKDEKPSSTAPGSVSRPARARPSCSRRCS
jgi:uncharacterized membrane protein